MRSIPAQHGYAVPKGQAPNQHAADRNDAGLMYSLPQNQGTRVEHASARVTGANFPALQQFRGLVRGLRAPSGDTTDKDRDNALMRAVTSMASPFGTTGGLL